MKRSELRKIKIGNEVFITTSENKVYVLCTVNGFENINNDVILYVTQHDYDKDKHIEI